MSQHMDPMPTDPATLAVLADRLPDVKVDPGAAAAFAQGLHPSDVRLPGWRGPAFPADDTDATAAYFLVANAVNFCFWGEPKWTVTLPEGACDGSMGLFAAFTRGLHEGIPLLDGHYLARMPAQDLRHVLRGNVEIPLFPERLAALRELGAALSECFDGRPSSLLSRAGGDARGLVHLIVHHCPTFDDRGTFRGTEVRFHKRAQLVPAMLHARFRGRSWGRLDGMDRLTVFADYKLPQVLREAGVLVYSGPLTARVDSREALPPGSDHELQIRTATLWAGELIRRALADRCPGITAVHVDGIIWAAGQTPGSVRRPYHRTRTTCY